MICYTVAPAQAVVVTPEQLAELTEDGTVWEADGGVWVDGEHGRRPVWVIHTIHTRPGDDQPGA